MLLITIFSYFISYGNNLPQFITGNNSLKPTAKNLPYILELSYDNFHTEMLTVGCIIFLNKIVNFSSLEKEFYLKNFLNNDPLSRKG